MSPKKKKKKKEKLYTYNTYKYTYANFLFSFNSRFDYLYFSSTIISLVVNHYIIVKMDIIR